MQLSQDRHLLVPKSPPKPSKKMVKYGFVVHATKIRQKTCMYVGAYSSCINRVPSFSVHQSGAPPWLTVRGGHTAAWNNLEGARAPLSPAHPTVM